MKKLTLLLFSFILLTSSLLAQDSTLIRIRVDVDSAKIQINNEDVIADSYGKTLVKDSWFILNLPIDTYNIKITSGLYDPIDSTIILVLKEIHTFDIRFIEIIYEDTAAYFKEIPASTEVVKLVLNSDPDSGTIVFGKKEIDDKTPAYMYVRPGEYSFIVSKEGYEPLMSLVKIEPEIPISANFKLKNFKPAPVTSDSLGLSYMVQKPMLSLKSTANIRKKYNALAESFAIFPLAQGILARLVVDKSQYGKTDGLIISGVVLTLGSYLLGKILYKKKRKYINEENERRILENAQVESNNQTVDQAVREENAARLKDWQKNNRNRGEVIFENLKDNN